MLTIDQIDVLGNALVPLFQYLEHEVIVDIARRIDNTMTYTRTAELMAMDMQRLGYSPAKIRAEAMKVLKADKEYQRAVEQNTLEYKKAVEEIIKDIAVKAATEGNEIVAAAGDMSWVNDISVWESNGKKLTDNSFLKQLKEGIGKQTVNEMTDLTRTTGFKTMSGMESIRNAYRNELDKAVIKICSGTFSRQKVIEDVIHNLAKSGIRTIDFASGRSMQLDTAVKLAIRTACNQISAKIEDENILKSGENLVYVSKHWGARNEGVGVANHEEWQGKVYFIKPGENYAEEAKRIGQAEIKNLWEETGYSVDGSNANNPLGMHGYNCRHRHGVFFKGISSIPDEEDEPGLFKINGKEYNYYQMTQKLRSMEREIRALKREREAREKLGLPNTEIKKKVKQKIRGYEEFCKTHKLAEQRENLNYQSGTSDITKTKAYKEYQKMKDEISAPVIKDKEMRKAYDAFESKLLDSSGNEKLVNNMLIYQDTTDIVYDPKLKSPFAYRPDEDKIVYNHKAQNFELYDMDYVQSHELAHRMDMKEYQSWNNKKFQEAIDIGRKKVYDNFEIIEKLFSRDSEYRYDMPLSDIISALSEGEVNYILTATHENEYWKIPRMKSMEIFANLCSIDINGYASKEIIEKIFPELLEAFERML